MSEPESDNVDHKQSDISGAVVAAHFELRDAVGESVFVSRDDDEFEAFEGSESNFGVLVLEVVCQSGCDLFHSPTAFVLEHLAELLNEPGC